MIEDRAVSIHDTIKKNSLLLFKRQKPKPKTKSKQQVSALRSDCNLFSRLYIATQHRSGDLDECFMHENQPYPPSLRVWNAKIRKKSELLTCVKPASTKQPDPPPLYDWKIFDGAAVVHALPSTTVSTFDSYAENVFFWIGLSMGKYVYISVNATCAFLGPETSRALPMFHSFTGCDTTSCFFGKGKKSAWDAWKSFPDVTEAFKFLQDHPYYQLDKDDSIFKPLERFTVVLYDKASNVINVNEARK